MAFVLQVLSRMVTISLRGFKCTAGWAVTHSVPCWLVGSVRSAVLPMRCNSLSHLPCWAELSWTVWVSILEQISLQSFARYGHCFQTFCYNPELSGPILFSWLHVRPSFQSYKVRAPLTASGMMCPVVTVEIGKDMLAPLKLLYLSIQLARFPGELKGSLRNVLLHLYSEPVAKAFHLEVLLKLRDGCVFPGISLLWGEGRARIRGQTAPHWPQSTRLTTAPRALCVCGRPAGRSALWDSKRSECLAHSLAFPGRVHAKGQSS